MRLARPVAALLMLAAGWAAVAQSGDEPLPPLEARPPLGFMGTIPLYWGEQAELSALVRGEGRHWARAYLEQDYELVPLAVLDGESLQSHSRLLLAQPRALSPEENVALDAWVRGGGQLLLFADPMMTGESTFSVGDPRRPHDVTLLTPLLNHWGLPLTFHDAQPDSERVVEIAGAPLPVRLAGQFRPASSTGCELQGAGVLATCRIGRGSVVVLADAALLNAQDPPAGASVALGWLVARAYGNSGENAGQ